MADFVPVNEPLLDGKEADYVGECLRSAWVSSEGPFIERFEQEFATRVGRKHGIAVCNGSAALDAAVRALDIGPEAEVILPTFTIISCASAVVRAGATPIVVDSDLHTWNMDVAQIEHRISSRTRAIMVVHIYGLPVDMEPVLALAKKHSLLIVEDAAEVIGQTYMGRPCGSFGDISTFSFYANKHITTGEGGMIVTDDDELAKRCRDLRNLCFLPHKRFLHEELGWNFRMSNVQAALGLAQLEKLDAHVARKRRMGRRYAALLADIPGLALPVASAGYAENIYWVYGLVLSEDTPFDAEHAMRVLAQQQIGTRPFFWPLHQQPVLRKMGLFARETYPVAERLARRGFYLPSGLALTDLQMDRVADAVRGLMV